MRFGRNISTYIVILLGTGFSFAQNNIRVTAQLIPEDRAIDMNTTIAYKNTSQDTLYSVYLTDWAHSFSSKQSPLAQYFTENYEKKFHLARSKDRGRTDIFSIAAGGQELEYRRHQEHLDVLEVSLQKPLLPGESYNLNIIYKVSLPNARFTKYGITRQGDYRLRFWFITPAVYDGKWHYYSNKNLNDRYFPKSDININFSLPQGYSIISDLDTRVNLTSFKPDEKVANLIGRDRVDAKVLIVQESDFESIETDYLTVITNLKDKKVLPQERALVVDKIAAFLDDKLGEYPHERLLVSDLDYKENPVYGFNELPSFITPFPRGFEYELKLLKTTLNNYVNNTILVNPRKDHWVLEGIKIFLFMKYIDTYYPDLNAIGNLSKYWLVRQFYASQLEFNDQFRLLYLHSARLNIDQASTTSRDSLTKFNENIASANKAGAGLNYLGEFIGQEKVLGAIRSLYKDYALEAIGASTFENLLRHASEKDIDWFFNDYLATRKKIDFTIKGSKIKGDSVYLKVKNKTKHSGPVALYGLQKDSIVSKQWLTNVKDEEVVAFPKDQANKYALNYKNEAPEINQRDNFKKPRGFLGLNKPFQFKLLQDIENPKKNQVFLLPTFQFNVYDGFSPGFDTFNRTILTKKLNYSFEPQYGLTSNRIIGSARISYRHDFDYGKLRALRYGISGNTASFAEDLQFRRFIPFVRFTFKPRDFRSDKSKTLNARFVSVTRDESPILQDVDPDYNVFNLRYTQRNPGIINTFNWSVDFQQARDFSKLSATAFYRRLYLNNRQLNLRFFGGAFLNNNTIENGDFFSFALDRPTDYLFDFNFFARSDESGFLSQQIIISEGGFKSRLEPAFANEWITTINASTTIWKYVYLYADAGLVKNQGQNAQLVYDSGIQVSLLDDFFEFYFPIYSNLGFEVAQPNYGERIRFVATIGIDTIIRLFARKWY